MPQSLAHILPRFLLSEQVLPIAPKLFIQVEKVMQLLPEKILFEGSFVPLEVYPWRYMS
jgi:hypothetical protein